MKLPPFTKNLAQRNIVYGDKNANEISTIMGLHQYSPPSLALAGTMTAVYHGLKTACR